MIRSPCQERPTRAQRSQPLTDQSPLMSEGVVLPSRYLRVCHSFQLRAGSGSKVPARKSRLAALVLLAALGGSACDDGLEPDIATTGFISPSDTTVFADDEFVLEAIVERRSGSSSADTAVWSVSDPEVLSLSELSGASVSVTALQRGTAFVIAAINLEFVDSALVSVVQTGDLRWQMDIAGVASTNGPAIDRDGLIYAVHTDGGSSTLSVFEPDGVARFSVNTCGGNLSPTLGPDGVAFTSNNECTRRHGGGGSVDWAVPIGSFDAGVAVAGDGSIRVVNGNPALLMTISPAGVLLRKDTLGAAPGLGHQAAAPVISSNGDSYVAWAEDEFGPTWLTRVDSDGLIRWTVPGVGWMHAAGPALVADMIVTTGRGGNLAVYDTTGARLWARQWDATLGGVSSPIVDADGNIYVQSQVTLISYESDGSLRWSADSLDCGNCGFAVGAPTILSDGELLVVCDAGAVTRELCSVNALDGGLNWRSSTGGSVRGSAAVSADGTIVLVSDGGVSALWGRTPALSDEWPTEGASMTRARRQQADK